MTIKRFVFISRLAFYPIHWQAFEYIRSHYQVECTVIASGTPEEIPAVHQQLGWIDLEKSGGSNIDLRLLPEGGRRKQMLWLVQQLFGLTPDAIWVQEEPNHYLLYTTLFRYRLDRHPRIAGAVCENIFAPKPWWIRRIRQMLWSRLDVLLGTAQASIDGIRKAGMPRSVRAVSLAAGVLPPPPEIKPMPLPFTRKKGDFVTGFVGRICEEKGWKVLLAAMEQLPANCKCILAGDGDQRKQLAETMANPSLSDRVFHFGMLPHENLMNFYKAADCLVLPSLTTPTWKEQFGGVLADGMAMGLPLIGSDSGSIPEVIGPAGLVVREGDAGDLAQAIRTMMDNNDLRLQFSEAGHRRYQEEFAIPAYAGKIARELSLSPIAKEYP